MIRFVLITALCVMPLVAVDENIIAWWRFDEVSGAAVADSAGSHDARVIGAAQWVTGRHGNALSLSDGAYVDAGTAPVFDLTSDCTVLCWIKTKPVSGGTGWAGLVSKYGPGSRGYDINLMTAPGVFEIGARGSSSIVGAKIGTAVFDDTWHHIGVVFRNNGFMLYQDGIRTAMKEGEWTALPSASSFLIGKRSGIDAFQGVIDDVKVYSRALSAAEIAAEHVRMPEQAALKKTPAVAAETVSVRTNTIDAGGSVTRAVMLPEPEAIFADTGTASTGSIVLRPPTVFESGNKRLNSREQVSTKPDRDNTIKLVIDEQDMAILQPWGASSSRKYWGNPFALKEGTTDCTLLADETNRTLRWEKPCRITENETATASYEAKVRADGKLEIAYRHGCTGALAKQINDFTLFVYFPSYRSQKITANGTMLTASPKTSLTKAGTEVFSGTSLDLAADADEPHRGFILTVRAPQIRITESLDYKGDPALAMRIDINKEADRINDPIIIVIDLLKTRGRASGPSPTAGIGFYGSDRITVPQPLTRNRIMNPSFESGLRYFSLQDTWAFYQPSTEPIYSVSGDRPKFGRSCLRMLARKPARPDQNRDSHLQTFAIPVVPGKSYTFSVWARASTQGIGLNAGTITGAWPVFPNLGISESRAVPTEWTRYTGTITAPNNVCSIILRAWRIAGDTPGYLYLDGLQFEEGTAATEFVTAPVDARLITSDPENFLAPGANIDARLIISSKSAGTAKLTLFNYFHETLYEKTIAFADAENVLRLPFGPELGSGVFVLRADIAGTAIPAHTEFFRFTVLQPLRNTHPTHTMFGSMLSIRSCRLEDICRRYRDVGLGSTDYGSVQPWYWALIEKYGITDTGVGLIDYHFEMPKKHTELPTAAKKWDAVTPEQEKEFEEWAYRIVSEFPHVPTWFFEAESEAGGWKMMRDKNVSDYAKLLVAGARGARRANPKALLMPEGGPCNMSPDVGIRQYDQYLTEIGTNMRFDAMAIHPYRSMPEYPADLDADIATFLRMLATHGYGADTPVHFTEGIYHSHMHVPAWGLNTFKACSTDHYRAGFVSYDMGWGERAAAALFARSWIMALKYWPQVRSLNGWVAHGFMDHDLTPIAMAMVPNTLGHLLGDVTFKSDFRPAPGVRGYIFLDGTQRPVMALWGHDDQIDRGFKKGPQISFTFGNEVPEIIDLMGNARTPIARGGIVEANVSPFPLFFRGKPGSLTAFTAAVNSGVIAGDNSCPLAVRAVPQTAGISIGIRNQTSRKVHAMIALPGDTTSTVTFDVLEEKLLPVPTSFDRSIGSLRRAALPVGITIDGGRFSEDVSFDYLFIPKRAVVLGDPASWKDVPHVLLVNSVDAKQPVQPSSLRARYQFAWDREHLYLRVSVKDDQFVHERYPRTNQRYLNDAVQVYFDTKADGRSSTVPGYGPDDYSYDLYPDENDRCIVYRWEAPEQQQAGGVLAPKAKMVETGIRTVFAQTEGGYIIEAMFPQRLILPLRLEAGYRAAFGICVNDRDDAEKKEYAGRLTTTPAGTEPGRSPQLYTLLMLAD